MELQMPWAVCGGRKEEKRRDRDQEEGENDGGKGGKGCSSWCEV